MAQPPFPCFAWRSEQPIDAQNILKAFLQIRPNNNWVMVGDGCIQSNIQLWTAWSCASRRWIRKTSLARSLDAEFLRYLSGTHHVSEAFKRAGVRDGDQAGCVVFLPNATSTDESQTDCQPVDFDHQQLKNQIAAMYSQLDIESTPMEFLLSKPGAIRLGMKFESGQETLTESTLIGHILSSEFTS